MMSHLSIEILILVVVQFEICPGSVINEFCDWHRQIKPILYKYQVARYDNNFDMGGHQYTIQVMEIMQ